MMTAILIVALILFGAMAIGLVNAALRGCPIALIAVLTGSLDALGEILKAILEGLNEATK